MRKELLAFWALYALALGAFLVNPMVVGWDPPEYLAYGKWMFSGYGFDVAYRPPVWAMVLGALWRVGLPMPLTMEVLAFLLYAAIPLVPYFAFDDSRRYMGLVIIAHPVFAKWSHQPLSHIPATLLFVLAYSASGPVAGALSALSGLTRFTFLLSVPFVCWNDPKKWKGALAVLGAYFLWVFLTYGSPLAQFRAASSIINSPNYLWFWSGSPLFYVGALFFSPLLIPGLCVRSRFRLAFLAALAYFTLLPHKEYRFFIDMLPYLAAAASEGYRRLPLLAAGFSVLMVPFYYAGFQLPPETFDVIPDGATVVGMTPEVNAYRDVHFHPWFDYDQPLPGGDYCIYFDGAVPCNNEECESKKQQFKDLCEPLYVDPQLDVLSGLWNSTQRPSAGQG
jgi:hypothetical protein